jgi:hypothetical protein
MRRVRALLAGLLALPLLGGCSWLEHGCTDVGGVDGMGVDVPRSMYLAVEGTVEVRVCDEDGCATASEPVGGLGGRAAPVGTAVEASWEDLGRAYDAGPVRVSATLRDSSGAVVARREQEVRLVDFYPNGKGCDPHVVHGRMRLEAGDRV